MVKPANNNSSIHSSQRFLPADCHKPQLQAVAGNNSSLQSMSDKPSTVWGFLSSIVSSIWNCLKKLFSCCRAASGENTPQNLCDDCLLKGKGFITQQLRPNNIPSTPTSSFKSALIIKLDDKIIGYHLGPITNTDPKSIQTFQDKAIESMNQALAGKTIPPESKLSIETFFIEKNDPSEVTLHSQWNWVKLYAKKPFFHNEDAGEGQSSSSCLDAMRLFKILSLSIKNDPIFENPLDNPIINYLLEEFRKK